MQGSISYENSILQASRSDFLTQHDKTKTIIIVIVEMTRRLDVQPAQSSRQLLQLDQRPPFRPAQPPTRQPSSEQIAECEKLLEKMMEGQGEIDKKVEAVGAWVEEKEFVGGLGYYNAKNMVFMEYLIQLQFYQLFKINGVDLTSGQGLALYQRLVYLKTLLTKLSPIEKKLDYQKNKMLKYSDLVAVKTSLPLHQQGEQPQQNVEDGEQVKEYDDQNEDEELNEMEEKPVNKKKKVIESEDEDQLAYQPRPQALVGVKVKKEKEQAVEGKYVAPKLSAALSKEDKIKRRLQMQEQRKKAFLIRKYQDDLVDTEDAQQRGVKDEITQKVKRKFKDKTLLQEQNFMRLPQTKKQKFWKKSLLRNQSRNNEMETDLAGLKQIGQIFEEERAGQPQKYGKKRVKRQ